MNQRGQAFDPAVRLLTTAACHSDWMPGFDITSSTAPNFQLLANRSPGRQQMMAWVLMSLPPTWQTQQEFQDPGFSLSQHPQSWVILRSHSAGVSTFQTD